MEGGGAYGSAGSTGNFDFVAFIKKPQVILRIVSWVFAIIVFGCISSQATYKSDCAYGSSSACGYGIAVGVIAFLGLISFLVLDAIFDGLSNVQHRRYIVIADIIFCGLWSFFWFVCFCLYTNKWTSSSSKTIYNKSGVEAAIAFAFFSTGTFVALTVLAVLRYRKGVSEDFFSTDYDASSSPPYAGAGQETSPPYQAGGGEYTPSPFTPQDSKPVPGGYQQQTY